MPKVRGHFVWVVGGVCWAAACSNSSPVPDSVVAEEQAAATAVPITLALSLPLPPGVSPDALTLAAANSLRVNDRVAVQGPFGAPATVSNVGALETNVGVDALVGNVWTKPALTLRDRGSVLGFLKTEGGILPQNQTTLGPMIQTTVPNVQTLATWTVSAPGTSAGDINLEPNQAANLAPGRYTAVNVKSTATLDLHTGTYVFDSLDLEPSASLKLDVADGPVFVYVRSTLIFRGNLAIANGGPGDVMFGYLGTSAASLEAPFSGTFVAPNAAVSLASLVGKPHRGAVFAQSLEVHQGNVLKAAEFNWWDVLDNGSCPTFSTGQLSALKPYVPSDYFRLCSAGTLLNKLRLLRPDIFTQLHQFEAAARRAEDVAQAAAHTMLDADLYAIDHVGTPPGLTTVQADNAYANTVGAVVAVVVQRDAAIDSAIAALPAGASQALTTAALAAWWANTRTALGSWFPPPHFDPSCEDVVKTEIGLDIAESLARNDLENYVRHLGRLVQALSCTRIDIALLYSQAVVAGIDDAVSRFPVALRPAAEHALVSTLTNVLIVLHDLTKFTGPTPLYTWLVAHKDELGTEIGRATNVVNETGLWLRHPSGDALVQLPNLCELTTSPGFCVSVGHLIDALSDPTRLGLGICSALEMVTKSATFNPAQGYFCEDSLCAAGPDGSRGPANDVPAGLVDTSGGTPRSLYGIALPALQQTLCNQTNQRDGGPGGGTLPGTTQAMRCMIKASAAGKQANLVQCLGKAKTENHTIQTRPHDTCTDPHAEDVGGDVAIPAVQLSKDDLAKDAEARKQAAAQAKSSAHVDALKAGAAQSNAEHAKGNDQLHYNVSKIDGQNAANAILGAVAVDSSSITTGFAAETPATIDTGSGTVTSGQIRMADTTIKNDSLAQLVKDYLHEGDHVALNAAVDKVTQKDGAGLAKKEHDIICGKGKTCDPLCEGENCGSCSPAVKEEEATLKCSLPTQGTPAVDPLAPLIYPDDSSGGKGAWSECFAGLTSGSLPPSVPPICAALMCAPNDTMSVDLAGCHCTPPNPGLPRFNASRCGAIDCADGMPVIGPTGFCGCSLGAFNISQIPLP